MPEAESEILDELLVTTKDGDWGRESPSDGHVPYHVIRGADFAAARVHDVRSVPVRYLTERTVARRTLQANDVLIETAGGTSDRPTGRTLLVTRQLLDQFNYPVTCASFARFLRADETLVDPRYLFWFLQNIYSAGEMFQHQVQHTGVARFQFRRFSSSRRIPLPPIESQRAIAEVLGALDDKIAANTTLVRTSDELAGALTRSSVDPEDTMALSVVAVITMGSSPPGASYNEDGVGTVFYQGVRDFGTRYPRNRVWTTMPVRVAQKNDCLLSVRAPVGELNLAGEATCIGRGLASVRSSDNAPMSLFHLLRDSPQIWAAYEAEGTVFGSINKQQLQSLHLPAVLTDRREVLEHELEALELRIAAALEENNQLAAIRDVLVTQLISGKIRMMDAEKTVEEVL